MMWCMRVLCFTFLHEQSPRTPDLRDSVRKRLVSQEVGNNVHGKELTNSILSTATFYIANASVRGKEMGSKYYDECMLYRDRGN